MTRADAEAIALKHSVRGIHMWLIGDVADAIMEAVALQRAHDAAICRRVQATSQQRIEIGLVCAREIERDSVSTGNEGG